MSIAPRACLTSLLLLLLSGCIYGESAISEGGNAQNNATTGQSGMTTGASETATAGDTTAGTGTPTATMATGRNCEMVCQPFTQPGIEGCMTQEVHDSCLASCKDVTISDIDLKKAADCASKAQGSNQCMKATQCFQGSRPEMCKLVGDPCGKDSIVCHYSQERLYCNPSCDDDRDCGGSGAMCDRSDGVCKMKLFLSPIENKCPDVPNLNESQIIIQGRVSGSTGQVCGIKCESNENCKSASLQPAVCNTELGICDVPCSLSADMSCDQDFVCKEGFCGSAVMCSLVPLTMCGSRKLGPITVRLECLRASENVGRACRLSQN